MPIPKVEKEVIIEIAEDVASEIDNRVDAEVRHLKNNYALSKVEAGRLYHQLIEHVISELEVFIGYERENSEFDRE